MALTELKLKNLKPKEKVYRVSDDGGLCVEVTPKGKKLWRYRCYFNGKPQMLALGKYPAVSLAKAREKRNEARGLVEAGKHPTREKKAQKLRQAYDGENTFENITRLWLDLKKTSLTEKYRTQTLSRLEKHVFPLIGSFPITEITIPDVVRVIEKISNNGTIETAKRMKQLISQTFRYAAQRGMCEHNPAADLRDVLPTYKVKHHACIPLGEIPAFFKAMDAREDSVSKYAMQLLALTFVRTKELIGAEWSEIDFEREEWNIPKERMKMKRPHMVPLSRQALEILKALQALTGDKEFVFHSFASKSKHLSNGTILMAIKRMGYKDVMTGHGFRTLASTILHEKSYNSDVIERQLSHNDKDKVRSAYNRAEYALERKKMTQDYADILDKMKKSDGKKVVGFKMGVKK